MENNNKINNMELNEDNLAHVSGGMNVIRKGGPIYSNCERCGKRFKSGNAGVNRAKYPLARVCPECAKKA